ncbi:MAG: NAD(P)/FAD-dependent oxidoreductase [Sphingobacteriales bacterium]|nr:MAG: NAD(P)/FAD-dependent oxidoreductase [Sphingobacteriales bacterium]
MKIIVVDDLFVFKFIYFHADILSLIMQNHYDIIIVGAGASGFFAAINIAKKKPNLKIAILEQSKKVLEKVKISGGGRCNVTNACSDPKELIKNYPRGGKNLLNAFYTFNTTHTIEWFEQHNIELKTEIDGRVFPKSNQSQTIIDCFLTLAKQHNIEIITEQKVVGIKINDNSFELKTLNTQYSCQQLILACSTNAIILKELEQKNIQIEPCIPSLFSFNTKNLLFKELSGITLQDCTAQIEQTKIKTEGNILITHQGITGPCVLKLSAFGAKELGNKNYNCNIIINWINKTTNEASEYIIDMKNISSKKKISNTKAFELPNRFWINLLHVSNINIEKNWADISKKEIQQLIENLTQFQLKINGKSTNKDEFVTAGGVCLSNIDLKTMQSKQYNKLFFTGEILDIDGITGGFNFQARWTTAYLVAEHIAK